MHDFHLLLHKCFLIWFNTYIVPGFHPRTDNGAHTFALLDICHNFRENLRKSIEFCEFGLISVAQRPTQAGSHTCLMQYCMQFGIKLYELKMWVPSLLISLFSCIKFATVQKNRFFFTFFRAVIDELPPKVVNAIHPFIIWVSVLVKQFKLVQIDLQISLNRFGPDGSKWVQIGPNLAKLVQVGPNQSKWVQMGQNIGPNGFRWVKIGPDFIKLVRI